MLIVSHRVSKPPAEPRAPRAVLGFKNLTFRCLLLLVQRLPQESF